MSIRTLLEAAEYLERRERGEWPIGRLTASNMDAVPGTADFDTAQTRPPGRAAELACPTGPRLTRPSPQRPSTATRPPCPSRPTFPGGDPRQRRRRGAGQCRSRRPPGEGRRLLRRRPLGLGAPSAHRVLTALDAPGDGRRPADRLFPLPGARTTSWRRTGEPPSSGHAGARSTTPCDVTDGGRRLPSGALGVLSAIRTCTY